MQIALDDRGPAHRRPAPLDVAAAVLLLGTVVLHVVAMAPTYFVGAGGGQSLMSQPDQAALYSVLAASWALALGLGMTGPHRTPVAAAMSVGIAVTELGFRVADLGDAVRYGTGTVGAGLWLMEAAWVVGAAAAVVAVFAARARHGNGPAAAGPASPSEVMPGPSANPSDTSTLADPWDIDWAAPAQPGVARDPYAEANPQTVTGSYEPAAPAAEAATTEESAPPAPGTEPGRDSAGGATGDHDPTTTLASPDPTTAWEMPVAAATNATDAEDPHETRAWIMLVVVLALVTAGAFLPAWDHTVAYSDVTGQRISRNLGNAFSGPWQQVFGTVLVAVALLAVPVIAVRLRNRAVGAAAVTGTLLVLASQFVAAVVQVDQAVSPALLGISPAQASRLGIHLSLQLTGWFTLDVIVAYALFAAVMVRATLKVVEESSPSTLSSWPGRRGDAVPWAS